MRTLLSLAFAAWMSLVGSGVASAQAADATKLQDQAKQVWQLLDYLAVDYGGAVKGGQVASESEFKEMREFAGAAGQQIASLPQGPQRATLERDAAKLQAMVEAKADAPAVSAAARSLAAALVNAYPFATAPSRSPDLVKARSLFAANCAACHGESGRGDGPLAAKLSPPPIAFSDRERAQSRSVFSLYQIVSQGVGGTAMPGFARLSEDDRWALAFFAGTLSHDDSMRSRGQALWERSAAVKAALPDLAAASMLSEKLLAEKIPADEARDVTAYVRDHPEVLSTSGSGSSLALARSRLAESMAAGRAGDQANATRLALSAYLDGFEPLEAALRARNATLLVSVENTMLSYQGALADRQLDAAEAASRKLEYLFAQVDSELGPDKADPATTFLASMTLLLREGVEALLIVVGMVAFLKKAQRPDVLRYVHAGWAVALACGVVTWFVATYFVSVSGASREVTEGLSSLFAAVVLLSVGLWMHHKSAAGRWQAYLREKMTAAMTRKSAWALFGLSFIAVYREVFETVLFYSALTGDGNHAALIAGFGAGSAILAAIAWLLLQSSARMPIGKFFAASSVLVAVLAVVLTGKGIAGLQEAGWLTATPVHWPRVEVLGVFPSAETVGAQLLVIALVLAGFAITTFKSRVPARAT